MERDARPALRRLVHALRHGSDVSAVMLRVLDEAEQAAARIDWSGGGVVAASSADDGAVVAPVREDGRRGGGGGAVKNDVISSAPPNPLTNADAQSTSNEPTEPDDEPTSPIQPREGGEGQVYDVDLTDMIAQGYTPEQIGRFLQRIGLENTDCCVQVVVPGFDPRFAGMEMGRHVPPEPVPATGQEDPHHAYAEGRGECTCVITLNIGWQNAGDPMWTDGRWWRGDFLAM